MFYNFKFYRELKRLSHIFGNDYWKNLKVGALDREYGFEARVQQLWEISTSTYNQYLAQSVQVVIQQNQFIWILTNT